MGDPEPVTPKGRNRHPSGGSTSGANPKVLSDRFSTFSPAKGIKRSESDSDIQKRRYVRFLELHSHIITRTVHFFQLKVFNLLPSVIALLT